jgi:hypothetical protein
MGYGEWTTDRLEQELISNQAQRSRLAARDLAILEELDSRQVATGDGCRSLSEWTASRLDVSLDTARSLVRTMRRTSHRPDLRKGLASGVSFDRVEALSRIPDDLGWWEHLDIAGIRREAAQRARISSEAEARNAADQYLILQPSLDESWWKLWGGLDGYSGAIVDKTLTEAADQLPPLPDGSRGDSSWRKATALTALAIGDNPPPAQITVFIDAQHAVGTDGEAGVVLEAGPRIGPDTLGAILCDGITEITVNAEDGIPISYGRHTRTIPPALRRAIIHRDANRCAADGCDSRNRLQVHHITPWSQGGPTDPDNLITLCWYHHHIVIHQQHSTLYLPSRTRPHPIQTTRTGATRRRLTHRNRTPVLVVQAP